MNRNYSHIVYTTINKLDEILKDIEAKQKELLAANDTPSSIAVKIQEGDKVIRCIKDLRYAITDEDF